MGPGYKAGERGGGGGGSPGVPASASPGGTGWGSRAELVVPLGRAFVGCDA